MLEVSYGQLHHTDIPNMSMQTISTKHLTKHMLNIRLEPDTGCPDHVYTHCDVYHHHCGTAVLQF